MKTITKTILIALLAVIGWSGSVNAQQTTPFVILDTSFLNYLINNPAINTDFDGSIGFISVAEAANYSGGIYVQGLSIADLTGIEAFTAITSLYCGSNSLSSINVSSNTLLQYFNCGGNNISTLDVSLNTALLQLACEGNQLTSLTVTNNTLLNQLSCGNNQLIGLNVANNPILAVLYCGQNAISSLNVDANPLLTTFSCGNNAINVLNVSNNTLLTVFDCAINHLTSLNVSSNTLLTYLDCQENNITTLNLASLTSLTSLHCQYNQLTSLNVQNGNNVNFTVFDATNNPSLTCIQVDNVAYSNTNWSAFKDAGASFSTSCSAMVSVNNMHTIAAGGNHSAYVIGDSHAAASGENTFGALGDNTTVDKSMPVKVINIIGQSSPPTLLSGVTSIAAGKTHTLFLKNDRTVWSSGSNLHGELGQGDIFDRWGNMIVPNLSNITAIAAGTNYSLFLKADGTVWACGSNMYGNLGDGTTTDRLTPVLVTGLTNVVAIAAGKENSLFLLSDGTVWGCGSNSFGELGTGTVDTHSSPIQISNLTGIVAISEGDTHSMFLKNNGTVWASGKNANGQLGIDSNTDTYTPVMMHNLSGVTAIAAGGAHSLSLKSDGTVWGCGSNSNGQLNSSSIFDRWGNLLVGAPTDTYTEIAAGSAHTVLKKSDGTVWACGLNSKGQLGDGTTLQRTTLVLVLLPTIPNLLASVQPIASGNSSQSSYFLCSIPGTPLVCGYNNYGQLGDGTTITRKTLVSVNGLTGIIAMSGGLVHSLFLKNDGTVWACGGNNFYGQLGDGTIITKTTPVQVHGPGNVGFLTGIIAIAAGYQHSLFLKNDGTVWACGHNNVGQLGDGTTTTRTTPVQVSGLTGIVAIAAGAEFSLFLKNDGTVWACGNNNTGQLGDGTNTLRSTPVQVHGENNVGFLTSVVAISGGLKYSLFLKNDNTVWACGDNGYSQLGDGTAINRTTPVQVHGENNIGFLTDITAIAAGAFHSLFLKNNGNVWACGYNVHGQLGDFTTAYRNTPVHVHGSGNVGFLTGITAIAAGVSHSMFLKNDNTVWACGYNNVGQLGDGTFTQRTTPVQMQYSHSIPTLSASANPICNGSATTLSIATGNLNGAANWQWYSGSCGGTSVGSGTSISVSPTITTTYYVRGEGGCINAGNCASITVTVKQKPTVAQPANRTYCSGVTMPGTTFFIGGAAGTIYSWINNNTSIGLAASGTGGIPIFSTINTTALPVTATITVTPTLTSAGLSCSGTPVSFTITVNPLPAVIQPGNLTVCNGSTTAAVNFINTIGSADTWTNNKPSIGLAASGSGDISSFTAVNNTNLPITATITVTPRKPSLAYIPISSSNTVSVINTVTDTVIATIPVGTNPFGVSVSRDGTKVYITNSGSDDVSVISTANNTVIATIPVGHIPKGVCVSPNGAKVYVANSSSNSVSVINTVTNTISAVVPVGSFPQGIAVNPNGSKVYVANTGSFNVSVINTVNNSVTSITVGGTPQAVAVNPTGTKVYVTNFNSNPSIINTSNNVVTPIALGSYSSGVTVSPNGSKVYVSSSWYGSGNFYFPYYSKLSVVDTVNNSVISSIITSTAGFAPQLSGISVTPDATKVYVIDMYDNKVSVINTANNSLITTIPTTGNSISLGNFITPAGCPGTPATFTITVNPTPKVNQPANQAICNGATTSPIHFTGLTAGTTYHWTNNNPSIGLAASGTGDISSFTATNASSSPVLAFITVTPSTTTGGLSCTGVARTFVIAVKPTPAVGITVLPSASVCAGRAVKLIGTGATSYSWTGGISNNIVFIPTATATYTVTGTSNGCSNTAMQTVTVNPLPVVGVVVSPSATVCSGTFVTLNGTGATTYSWSGGIFNNIAFTPTTTATYTVTGTSLGCSKTATQIITVNPLPAAIIVKGGGITQCGGTIVLTAFGGTGGTIYWQGTTSGGTSTATASSSQTVSASGTYYFRSQSALGCWGPEGSATVTINAPTSHTTTVSACDTYTWATPLGDGLAHTISGTYTHISTNASGCKHTETLVLIINSTSTPPIITAIGSCEGSTFQWTQTATPPGGTVWGLATIGTNIFAGTTSGGVYHSTNNGVTWTQCNGAFPDMEVYCLVANGSNLYAGTGGLFGGGVYTSSNNGVTWTNITPSSLNSSTNVRALVVDGTNIFAGIFGGQVGIFKSSLSGISTSSWTTFNTGLSNNDIRALAISGTNILAGTYGNGVWVSPTSIDNWSSTIGISQPSSYIETLDVIGATVLAGDISGTPILYRSTDYGQTWSSPAVAQFVNTPIYSIIHHGNAIYVGTEYGAVSISTDDGVTWTPFNDGFKDASGNWYCNTINVRSFCFIGDRIFAGTDCGVWTSGTCSGAIDVLPNGDITFCQGSSVVLTSSSATGNTWSTGATTQSITVTSSGSYSVTISNGDCSATSSATLSTKNCFMKQAQVTSNEIPSTSVFGVKANPNPYSDIFNLTVTTSSEEKVGIRVYDMIGRLIEQRDARPSEIDGLQMGIGYPTGVYNIVLSQGTDVKALRVVKR